MIYLSDAAYGEIKRLLVQHQPSTLSCRLSITQGGCAGLTYSLELDSDSDPNDHIEAINQINILIDPISLPCVDGLTIDYAEDLMGGAFRFYNPNAVSTCSCGNSFSINYPIPS